MAYVKIGVGGPVGSGKTALTYFNVKYLTVDEYNDNFIIISTKGDKFSPIERNSENFIPCPLGG